MRELIELLASSLLNDPTRAEVRELGGGGSYTYEIVVSPEDAGKLIGRQGRTINAVRTIAKAAATKAGVKVQVEVVS